MRRKGCVAPKSLSCLKRRRNKLQVGKTLMDRCTGSTCRYMVTVDELPMELMSLITQDSAIIRK